MKIGSFTPHMASAQDFSVVEEKTFSDPIVRFRRINGRVVPIFNKKRIGGDLQRAGNVGVMGGAGAMAASVALKKLRQNNSYKRAALRATKFKAGASVVSRALPAPKRIPDTRGYKITKKVARGVGSALKTALRHPGKLGIGLFVGGLAAKILGTELELSSAWGKDYGAR